MKKIWNNIVSKLIVINISYGILDIFLSSFLISYIMRSFDNQIVGVALFYIFWAATVWAGFVAVGDWTKRKNKMNVFRISILLRIAACIILGICELNMPVAILVASILGLSDGAMNLPWHNIISEKLTRQQLIQYSGYRQSVSHLAKVTLPVLIGALITASSYTVMVWLVIPFSVLSFLVSFTVQSKPTSTQPVRLRPYARRACQCRFTRRLLWAEFLRGLSFDRITVMMTMLIVYFMHTDLALGGVKSLQSLFMIVMGIILGRFLTPAGFPRLIALADFCIVAVSLIFFAMPTTAMLITYLLIYTVAEKIFFQMMEMNMTNGSNYNTLNCRHKIEYFITRESTLNLGRIVNLLGLLVIGLMGGGVNAVIIYLVAMVLLTIPLARLSIGISCDINKKNPR